MMRVGTPYWFQGLLTLEDFSNSFNANLTKMSRHRFKVCGWEYKSGIKIPKQRKPKAWWKHFVTAPAADSAPQ